MTSLEEEFLEELLQNEYGRLLLGEETAAKLRAKLRKMVGMIALNRFCIRQPYAHIRKL